MSSHSIQSTQMLPMSATPPDASVATPTDSMAGFEVAIHGNNRPTSGNNIRHE